MSRYGLFDKSSEVSIPIGRKIVVTQLLFLEKYKTFSRCYHMTKNTYNPYEIMMDKYDKEEMLSDVRESMLYQLGADVSCEELDHFFTGKGKAALSGCAEWQQCFAVEKMLEFYYVHARDETLAKQIETMTMLASRGNEHHG